MAVVAVVVVVAVVAAVVAVVVAVVADASRSFKRGFQKDVEKTIQVCGVKTAMLRRGLIRNFPAAIFTKRKSKRRTNSILLGSLR